MRMCAFDHYANRGRISVSDGYTQEGQGKMAKDMSNVYADMLTKELVSLRRKHMEAHAEKMESGRRLDKIEAARRADLVRQIETELANRVASFNLFV